MIVSLELHANKRTTRSRRLRSDPKGSIQRQRPRVIWGGCELQLVHIKDDVPLRMSLNDNNKGHATAAFDRNKNHIF